MAGRNEVSGLFVGSVTDLGHGGLSLESSSDLVVRSSPRRNPRSGQRGL